MTIRIGTPLLAAGALNALTICVAHADFLKDGKASIDTRNFYLLNDYREGTGQNKSEEWAQGFTFKFLSGYTDGNIGFGLDTALMVGLKLDSSPERSGTGLLARDAQAASGDPSYARRAKDDYSKLNLTGKVRLYEDTVVQFGSITPMLGVLRPSTTRLFNQSFRGAQIINKSVENLTLAAGRIDGTRQRDSSDYEDVRISPGQYIGTKGSDFDFVSADYEFSPKLNLSYNFAELENVYNQQFFGVKGKVPAGTGSVVGEVRIFASSDSGASWAGEIDNQVYSGQFGYSLAGHTLQAGYQQVTGDSALPYLEGTVSYLLTQMMVANFGKADQRSWLARYDYNFAAAGVPGLLFTWRYVTSDNAKVVGFAGEGKEREMDTELSYVVQSGTLKGVALTWRHGVQRNNYSRDSDQDRLIVDYSIKF